jgi:hypothetical protein
MYSAICLGCGFDTVKTASLKLKNFSTGLETAGNLAAITNFEEWALI